MADNPADYTSALYVFVVMAYATLAISQYTKNGTTQKIKDEKARAEALWNDRFNALRVNADKCPTVREKLDLIKSRTETMRELPIRLLFAIVVVSSLLLLWNVTIKAMLLNGNAITYLGYSVMAVYIVLTALIIWIGVEIWLHSRTARTIRASVDSWVGIAETNLDTVLRYDAEKNGQAANR